MIYIISLLTNRKVQFAFSCLCHYRLLKPEGLCFLMDCLSENCVFEPHWAIAFLPIADTRPFQWFSAFLLIADCQNPQPVHPGGWVRGARTHLLHPQDPGSLEAEARCPDRGQYSADGHQVLFPCHLPLQPVQHLAGYHRRPRATAPRIPEEGVIGVECSTTRVIEVTVYMTVCLRACRNMDCEERVQGPAGCSIPLRVMLWQKAV